MNTLSKLAYQTGNDWIPHSYPPIFTTEVTSEQTKRLVAGVPGGDVTVLLKMMECLAPPFLVLYILHTPRGEGESGRYQSPEISLTELQNFISRFATFFGADARFDIWVHSSSTNGTVVWDRHNLIYGYGPIECFNRALHELGFSEDKPTIPDPHMHYYRSELDAEARAILATFPWHHSPLHSEDEQ